MKHPALAKIRGLVIVIEQSKDPNRILEAIREIVEHLKVLNKVAISLLEQNKARFQPPR